MEVENTVATDYIIKTVEQCLKRCDTDWFLHHNAMMPDNVAIRELRTIKIQLPRAMGHSTAALELAALYPKSMILYPSPRFMEHNHDNELYNQTKDRRYVCPNPYNVISDAAYLTRTITSQLDLIIFDSSSYWTSYHYTQPHPKNSDKHDILQYNQIDEFSKLLSPYTKLFVRLG